MGCFSTCFGTSKRQRRPRRRPVKRPNPSLLEHLQNYQSVEDFQVKKLVEEVKTEEPIDPSPEPVVSCSDEKRERANLSVRKKVTFDLNVKIYEDLPREEGEENDGGERERKQRKEESASEDSSSSSLFSYPPNHRYQNCRDSDDEFDDVLSSDESEIDDFTDDDDEEDYADDNEAESEIKKDKSVVAAQEQSSESLFSLSLDSRKQNFGAENGDKEVNSPMPTKLFVSPSNDSSLNARYDRSRYVDSVLNPVENVAQWKVIKAKSRRAASENQTHQQESKENLNTTQDFSFPVGKEAEFEGKEVAVDTSLSTWLVGSERGASPSSRNSSVSVGNSASGRTVSATDFSPKKFEDRPILGALTVEEIRQFSVSNSPRKSSPSKSPDDMPIIGTVGSYWSHTGQTSNSGSSTKSICRSRSRFSESKEVIWDSTPFEARLEKALEREVSTVQQALKA